MDLTLVRERIRLDDRPVDGLTRADQVEYLRSCLIAHCGVTLGMKATKSASASASTHSPGRDGSSAPKNPVTHPWGFYVATVLRAMVSPLPFPCT